MNRKDYASVSARRKMADQDWVGGRGGSILYRFRVLFYTGRAVSVLLVTALGMLSYLTLSQQQACCLSQLPSFQRFEYIKAVVAIGTLIVLGIVAFLVYVVLTELNSRFRAYQHEHELNQMKSKFITLASHEFRTPLSSILLSAALIEKYVQKEDKESIVKHSQKIKQVVHRLEGILDDFLSLEKLNAGHIKAEHININLDLLCRETLEAATRGAAPGQKFSYEPSGNASEVALDAGLIKNALCNLLSNAIKYAGEEAEIRLLIEVTPRRTSIRVIDNGVGIAEKDQEQLTSTFYRVGDSGNIPGTGLGLYLVRRYVDLMGGELHFYSIPGQETCFEMTFDIAAQAKS